MSRIFNKFGCQSPCKTTHCLSPVSYLALHSPWAQIRCSRLMLSHTSEGGVEVAEPPGVDTGKARLNLIQVVMLAVKLRSLYRGVTVFCFC